MIYPRIEATHVPITDATSVDDTVPYHVVPAFLSFTLIYPRGLIPVVVWDQTEFGASAGEYGYASGKEVLALESGRDLKSSHFLNSSEKGSSFKNVQGY
jgi:hypothetical protein